MKTHRLLFIVLRFFFQTIGRCLPSLGGRAALRLFCMPFPARLSNPAQAFLKASRRQVRRFAGVDIETFSQGEGPAVLLVHGWNSHAASWRAFAAPLIATGHRVVAVNLPAHGGSSGRVTNMLESSRVLAALIRAEAPVAGIVAHSFGGPAALLALRNEPDLPVGRLAMIGSPIEMGKVLSDFSRRFRLSPATNRNLRERIDRIFGESLVDFDATAIAAGLAERLLVVHDTGDRDVPVAEARILASGDGVQSLITDGYGHNRILRQDPVIQRIVEHING